MFHIQVTQIAPKSKHRRRFEDLILEPVLPAHVPINHDSRALSKGWRLA